MNSRPSFSAGARIAFAVFLHLLPGRRCAFAALVLTATVAAFHGIEYFRGRWAWEACRAASEKKGVELSLAKLIPISDVPDAENFAKLPLIRAGVIAKRGEGPLPADLDLPGAALRALAADNTATDLHQLRAELITAGWIDEDDAASDADACLHGLSRFDKPLAELRPGLQRPFARYARDLAHPENMDVPPFLLLRKAAQILRLRFEAHAASGQLDSACDDFEFALGLARTLDQSPTLVGSMIQVATSYLAVEGVEAWLARAPWTEAQLARLSLATDGFDFLRNVSRALAVERASFVNTGLRLASGEMGLLDAFQRDPQFTAPESFRQKEKRLVAKLYPRGWHYQSLVWAAPAFDEVASHLDAAAHRWHPPRSIPTFISTSAASRKFDWGMLSSLCPTISARNGAASPCRRVST